MKRICPIVQRCNVACHVATTVNHGKWGKTPGKWGKTGAWLGRNFFENFVYLNYDK